MCVSARVEKINRFHCGIDESGSCANIQKSGKSRKLLWTTKINTYSQTVMVWSFWYWYLRIEYTKGSFKYYVIKGDGWKICVESFCPDHVFDFGRNPWHKSPRKRRITLKMAILTKKSKIFIKAKLMVSKSYLIVLVY